MTRAVPAAALAALLLASAAAAPVRDGPPVYFPTAVGAKWVYTDAAGSDHTEVVTAVERKDGAVVVTVAYERGDGDLHPVKTVAVSETGLRQLSDGDHRYAPPSVLLRLPHRDGNAWRDDTEVVRESRVYRGTCTAHGPERVRVPAGVFEAVRVESEYTLNGIPCWLTVWFAPRVGAVKWSGGSGRKEDDKRPNGQVLKRFTPGKG